MPVGALPVPSAAPSGGAVPIAPAMEMPARPYPYEAMPPAPPIRRERAVPAEKKRGPSGLAMAVIALVILAVIGGGIYYAMNSQGPSLPGPASSPPPSDQQPSGTSSEPPSGNQQPSGTSSEADGTPPVITDVNVTGVTDTDATITWTTDEPATSQVIALNPDGVSTQTDPDQKLVTDHSVILSGLKPDVNYHFTVISSASGKEATAKGDLTTSRSASNDTTPPLITDVKVTDITDTGATITWTTDEPATTQIQYGETEDLGSETPLDEKLTTSHTVTLSDLETGKTYYVLAVSSDAAGNEGTADQTSTFETSSTPAGNKEGNRAPDFTLQDLDGNDVPLSSFRGSIVMVNFWATWCQPCKDELPFIQTVSDNWADKNVVVLEVAEKENEDLNTVKQFVTDNNYTMQMLFDTDGQVNSLYGVGTIPATFFIDPEGVIQKVQVGSFDSESQIEDILNSLSSSSQ